MFSRTLLAGSVLFLITLSSTAQADSGRFHLHLGAAAGAPLVGQARPQPGGTSAGGAAFLDLDYQLAAPFAIELQAAVGGFARPYPHSGRTGTRFGELMLGARFRLLEDSAGYISDRGGNWPSHLWLSAHVGFMQLDGPQFAFDVGVGYALSAWRPFQFGPFLRVAMGVAGDEPGPDLVLVGGIEFTFELLGAAAPRDSDADGLSDEEEARLSTRNEDEDSDGDGILDGVEVRLGSNPLSADTDNDGIADGREDRNRNGVLDPGETDPRRGDTDGGGMPDPEEIAAPAQNPRNEADDDDDGDHVGNHIDACPGTPTGTTVDGVGCAALPEGRFVLDGVTFISGSARIDEASEPVLLQAAETLRRYPTRRFEIGGHTDDRGNPRRNLRLSRQRADAVKRWLVQHGLPAAQFDTAGYGSAIPAESNETEEGRAKNRRIEFRPVL